MASSVASRLNCRSLSGEALRFSFTATVAEVLVDGEVDGAHAALPQHAFDAVTTVEEDAGFQ